MDTRVEGVRERLRMGATDRPRDTGATTARTGVDLGETRPLAEPSRDPITVDPVLGLGEFSVL